MLTARGVWRATLPTARRRGGHSTPCNTADVGGRGAPGLDAAVGMEPGQTPYWHRRGDHVSPNSHKLTSRKRLPHNTAYCTEINKDENDKKNTTFKS